MGTMIEFPSHGGTTSGFLAQPASGSGAGVIVIQEWWGLNQHVQDVATRLAHEGFLALAPDLYHGRVTRSPDEAGKLLMALNIAQAERDLRGAVAHLRAQSGRAVGTLGFCMGGALSLFAACTNGAEVGACVVYYGGHPHVTYAFDQLRAPVLGHWAEDDAWANANVPLIDAGLRQHGKTWDSYVYQGTKHAFFNDTRPEVYDRTAAESSWARTLAFFRQHL